ncbi:hypothetical protein R1flu_028867 [Riccia fluitans]|uniref:Secreted protein n=1 Tax=Riccia fluitans TaxID=41844 RepID=A0ABD1XMY2_9MARC
MTRSLGNTLRADCQCILPEMIASVETLSVLLCVMSVWASESELHRSSNSSLASQDAVCDGFLYLQVFAVRGLGSASGSWSVPPSFAEWDHGLQDSRLPI